MKATGNRLQVTVMIFLFLLLPTACYLSPVFAADSTPSADIASKLKAFQKEAASKAAQLKELISKRLQNKAFVGTLESQSGNSLTLAAKSGPKIISLNEDTLFESNTKSKQKFSRKNLTSGDYVAALGDADETGILTAKKIILEASPSSALKTYLWGQIISVSDQLITLRGEDFKNVAVSVSKTFRFKLNDFVILTGGFDKNNIFSAQFVYVIPQAVIKPKKSATPSANIN